MIHHYERDRAHESTRVIADRVATSLQLAHAELLDQWLSLPNGSDKNAAIALLDLVADTLEALGVGAELDRLPTDTVRMVPHLIDVGRLRPGKPAVPGSVTRDATTGEQVPGQLPLPDAAAVGFVHCPVCGDWSDPAVHGGHQ